MSVSLAELEAAVAGQPREAWPALVRARAGGDPVLAAQALAWLTASAARGPAGDGAPDLGPGAARYELGVLLDRGATGQVWQAFDHKLGRNVAIKVFDDDASPAVEHGLAEARAASEINSDHVVRVLDVHDRAPPYLVMELVGEHDPATGELAPGASAATCRPVDLDEAVRWARDVARGVHDAHLRNVFHRDLKPHNVLVAPFSRRAKIADFGLAVRAAGDDGLALASGRIAGTPAYMAPEQARGLPVLDPERADDRAVLVGIDVWGIGALAHALSTGRPPWEPRGDLEAWEVAASAEAPPPLTTLATGGPVPRRLRRVIAKALAPARAERYPTAAALAADLDAFLARRPTSLDRARHVRFGLWCARNPQLALTALAAVVLAGLSLGAHATLRDVRAQRNALRAEIAAATTANADLARRAAETRAELRTTEAGLAEREAALAELQAGLTRANADYAEVVAATERSLRDADAATRELVTRLGQARRAGEAAQLGRTLAETFLARTRGKLEQAERDLAAAIRERDAVRGERDAARRAHEQLAYEREAAQLARQQAEDERDAARAERDRAEATRRRLERDLARVAGQLAAALGSTRAAGPDASPSEGEVADAARPAAAPGGGGEGLAAP